MRMHDPKTCPAATASRAFRILLKGYCTGENIQEYHQYNRVHISPLLKATTVRNFMKAEWQGKV